MRAWGAGVVRWWRRGGGRRAAGVMRHILVVLCRIFADLVTVAGLAGVVVGCAQVHPAAGWIAGGGLVAWLGVTVARAVAPATTDRKVGEGS